MGLGYNSLNKLEDGSGNVAIGAQTLTGLISGYRNVAIGRQAGRDINDPGIGQTNFVDGLLGGADLVSGNENVYICLLYTSPSPRDRQKSRMPSSA